METRMKKIISVLLLAALLLTAFVSCATPTTEAPAPETTEPGETTEKIEEDVYPSDKDNFAGTPAYTVDGDKIIVDGVAYPNTNNMKIGPTFAIDDLDRELPTAESESSMNYISENKNVGVFYFLWMGQHGDSGALDMTKIYEEGGEAALKASYKGWGPVGAMHFWGEPLYGYYYSSDIWVMRKHIEELTLANVDFLYIDATNGYPYINNAKNLMQVMHEFNEQGYDAPQIVFYTNTKPAATVTEIYNSIYAKNYLPDTWFTIDGKPVIITHEGQCKNQSWYDFFTYREAQWPNENQKTNGWPWMDFSTRPRIFKNKDGEKDAISVSVAQHAGTVRFSDSAFYGNRTNRGRGWHDKAHDGSYEAVYGGYNFQEQWDRAIKVDVPYVLVTGWNEWVAQRQSPGASNQVIFVDTASLEYSRDIEPMRGGYFDNFYIQMIDNIRRYKGTAPTLVQNTRKLIDLKGSFDQWDDILVNYTDYEGDALARVAKGFGNTRYLSTTGSNDIVGAKVVHDTKYLYFYVQTADTNNVGESIVMTDYTTEGTWMQLFINVDMETTGFYGYDYIINYNPKDAETTTLAKHNGEKNEFAYTDVCDINYSKSGCEMMIRVPLAELGIEDYEKIKFSFKWVDSATEITTMEQMYEEGDCAPIGRLDFIFQNYK